MKSVLQGVWGTPHQAKGGDSSESPPDVFWLQKTLLATFVALTVLLEMVCDFIAVFKRAEISSSFHLYIQIIKIYLTI